jgi:hypothetical protein
VASATSTLSVRKQEAFMRKLATIVVAFSFLLGAGAVMADQMIGVVEKIDPASKTIWVNGNPFHFEDGVVPLKFAEVKVGDKVRLEYDTNTNQVYEADHAK